MRVQIHPYAESDLNHQIDYLLLGNSGDSTIRKFKLAVRQAKGKIRDNPRTWSLVSGSTKVRKVQILEFRMQVFYSIQSNGVPLILEFAGPGLQPRWAERL